MVGIASHRRIKKMASLGRTAACLAGCGIAVLALPACKQTPIVPDTLNPPAINTTEVPDYAELVSRYNANADALQQLWARTKVELRWRDEKDRARRESGDGQLLFERPLNTAMTVEVLGDVKMWAGSDENGFWLFDLLGDRTAYFGAYDMPLARPLPWPVQPEAVPYLLGLMPIDPDHRPSAPEVELFNGYCIIEPPALNLRMQLHPVTGRPTRIDFIDASGQSVLRCILSEEVQVETQNGSTAVLPGKAEVYPVGEESRMTLDIRRASTDSKRIQSKFFRFDTLSRSLKPDEVIDLNQP